MGLILTEKELSQFLKVSTVHLYHCRKRGMPFIKLGACVRYSLDDVLAWLKSRELHCKEI